MLPIRIPQAQPEFEAVQHSGEEIEWSGYAYTLTQRVKVARNSQNIILEQTLDNTGRKELKLQNYLHPFFTGASRSRIKLGKTLEMTDISRDKVFTKMQLGTKCDKVGIAFSETLQIEIASDRYYSRLKLWYDPGRDLFAVEPYVDITIEAGKSFKWNWMLKCKTKEHKHKD